ncbi:MAG: hypothetical protein NVSMB47_13240 [Polyangiales bacterium]
MNDAVNDAPNDAPNLAPNLAPNHAPIDPRCSWTHRLGNWLSSAAPMRRTFVAATIGLALSSASGAARAYEAEVEAQTIGQAYQLRGPTGDPILSRRRITQTLGLGVYDLLGHDKSDGPQLFFRTRLRVDADFGMAREEYAISNNPDFQRYIPGLQPAPLDVMYGYLEGRRFLHGWMGFKVGRQYVVDPLGFYSFDGASVRVTTPAYFSIELYGGAEQRAGLPLSTGRWELGGLQRGNRTDFPADRYPSFQKAGLAPVYAVALESAGPTWVHARLTYRKVLNTGESFVAANGALLGPNSMAIYDTRRVSSERLGYGLNVELGSIAALRTTLAYDLYGKQWSNIEAGADVFLGQKVTVGVDYDYYRPVFDGDSIFGSFGFEPTDDVNARIEVEPTDHLSFEGDAMVRRYRSDRCTRQADGTCSVADLGQVASSYAPGGGLRARYRWAAARATLRSTVLSGDQGNRYGGDAIYERSLLTRWLLDARLSLWHFEDKLRPGPGGPGTGDRSATSIGYVLGGGYQLSTDASAFLQFEHDTNRLVGQRLRLMAVLNVRTWI